MIAPTNCNLNCDCAQRMVRCQRAAPVSRDSDHPWLRNDKVLEQLTGFELEPPPYVIPASLGEQKKMPLSDIPSEELVDLMKLVVVVREDGLRERLIRAFRTCELDCGMWSDSALNELADITIATLEAT